MSDAHLIPELDRKGLREFGLTTGAIVALLFGLFFPWILEHGFPVWPWAVAVVLGAWALLAPASLRPVYRVWMRLGLLLSKVTVPVIMLAVFLLVITPLGLARRALGKSAIPKRPLPTVDTYRVPAKRIREEDLERPF